jgi:hypothetical protein
MKQTALISLSPGLERLNRREQDRTEAACISARPERVNRTEAACISTSEERLNRTAQTLLAFAMAQSA